MNGESARGRRVLSPFTVHRSLLFGQSQRPQTLSPPASRSARASPPDRESPGRFVAAALDAQQPSGNRDADSSIDLHLRQQTYRELGELARRVVRDALGEGVALLGHLEHVGRDRRHLGGRRTAAQRTSASKSALRVAESTRSLRAVRGLRPSSARLTAPSAARPMAYPLPSSPICHPYPPMRCCCPSRSRPTATLPVPALTTIPAPRRRPPRARSRCP